MNEDIKKKVNIRKLGDSLFSTELEELVNNQPYMAFVNLSAILEFIARCKYYKLFDEVSGKIGDMCYDAINNIKALEKYKELNYPNGEKKEANHLYKSIRCGMLHSLLPKKEIKLNDDNNDLNNMVVGAKELYHDLKEAWEEVKKESELLTIMNLEVIQVNLSTSAKTESDYDIYQ